MQLTLIGLVIFLAGTILLWSGSLEAMFAFAVICTLMGGAGAVILTALGSSSIPPVSVATIFLAIRVAVPGKEPKPLGQALAANASFLIFAAYAVLTAMIMPRLFAGEIDVAPLRALTIHGLQDIYNVVPLKFTPQNITSSAYIVGSCLLAFCSFVAVRTFNGAVCFVKTAVILVWAHVLTGLGSVLLPSSIWSIVDAIFRNGSYGQLDQTIEGYSRVAGIMPEASGYASYGFMWFAMVTELWLRDVMPRRTGPAAAALAMMLVISTSTTGYISLSVYALILVLRMIIFPNAFGFRKVAALLVAATVLLTACLALLAFKPATADTLVSILRRVTVDKTGSISALQRSFWAKQGITDFLQSYGFGIGAGSFRSSNLVTAILGSAGIIGAGAFGIYLIQIFRPLRNSTYGRSRDYVEAIGVSASWAVLCFMIPALLAAPSADPGPYFAIFAGVSLGLRTLPFGVRRPVLARRSGRLAIEAGRPLPRAWSPALEMGAGANP